MELAVILFKWAQDSPERKQQIQDAIDSCVLALLENKGKEVTSGNVGDASFSFGSNSLTYEQFLDALTKSQEFINQGFVTNSRISRVVFNR